MSSHASGTAIPPSPFAAAACNATHDTAIAALAAALAATAAYTAAALAAALATATFASTALTAALSAAAHARRNMGRHRRLFSLGDHELHKYMLRRHV